MLIRVVAMVLAVILTGAVVPAVHASPDMMSEIDEASENSIVPVAVVVPWPDRGPIALDASRLLGRGRAHDCFVFRPPR